MEISYEKQEREREFTRTIDETEICKRNEKEKKCTEKAKKKKMYRRQNGTKIRTRGKKICFGRNESLQH